MKRRCFAFGCSYTYYNWATVSDFVGIHFDEFYNFGKAGASNTYIMNSLMEYNEIFKFNPETDYILIGITGIGRFSYFDGKTNTWMCTGDAWPLNSDHPPIIKQFVETMDNPKWALYRSWIAVKVIKEFLVSKKLIHTVYPALNGAYFCRDTGILQQGDTMIQRYYEIYDTLDIKESIDESITDSNHYRFTDTGAIDNHPTQTHHYNYFKKHFPQFNDDYAKNVHEYLEKNFDNNSVDAQQDNFKTTFRSSHHMAKLRSFFNS